MQSGCRRYMSVLCLSIVVSVSTAARLYQNGYEGVLVAINPRVSEDPDIIQSIKSMFIEASPFLFKATRRRAFFKEVRILVPVTWRENHTLYHRPTAADTYRKAQVVISDPFCQNLAQSPYTVSNGLCGQPGQYIHLTPRYLLDQQVTEKYGPKGRVLVHSWATLRWGVFSEFDSHTPFYRSTLGNIEATRCSKFVEGSLFDKDRGGECQINPDTGLPSADCVFQLRETLNTTASIMYQHFVPEISEFCDDSSHNFEAPNAQNRLCNYRSVWDVIMESSDFSQGANTPMYTQPEAPSFTLVRVRHRVICLVLDVSGSMGSADRINRQRQAAEVFLVQTVEEGSMVGLVSFNHAGRILANLTEVTDLSSREQLASRLPSAPGGGTDICAGLRMGFEVLKQDDGQTAGDEIILLTDGEDSSARQCVSEVKNSGVIVHTIAFGPNADEALEQFANTTGGRQFFASDNLNSNGLIEVFSDVTSESGDDTKTPIQLLSIAKYVAAGQVFRGTVSLDTSVGNNTVFTFTWKMAEPEISLQDPSFSTYEGNVTKDLGIRIAYLRIPGVAQPGTWSFSLLNTDTSSQTLTVTVSSYAVHECVPPVKVTPTLDNINLIYPKPLTIMATVSQGDRPVLGAVVLAILEDNSGSRVELKLLDDGVGVDVTRDDGVYSAYFYRYSKDGRYSVKVEVEGAGDSVNVKTDVSGNTIPIRPGYVDINGTVHPPTPSGGGVNETTSALGNFSRTISGGAITISQVPAVPQEKFPPGRVTDLTASLTNQSQVNQSLVLEWTAPGEDYYVGTVSSYDIRFSLVPTSLRNNFSSTESLNFSLPSPLPAGQRESVPLSLDKVSFGEGATLLFFALRAWDKEGLVSETSNIAQVSIFIYHPPPPSPLPSSSPSATSNALALILPLSIVLPIVFISCCSIFAAVLFRRRRRRSNSLPPTALGYPNTMVMGKIF